jgi:putative membrane protein
LASAPFDETRDATRRTRLASERTYLAWWRTGVTALAVGFGAGKLLPALTDSPSWPFEVVGAAYAVVGGAAILFGYVRQRDTERALRQGDFARIPETAALAFTAAGLVLTLGTLLLLVFAR